MQTKTNSGLELISENNLKNIIFGVNKRIEKIFAHRPEGHKDIFSLIDEVENGYCPTVLEVKIYENLRYKFRSLFLSLNLK